MVEGALDVPEEREHRDEQRGEPDGPQGLDGSLAGEGGERGGDGRARSDSHLRVDVALQAVADLRLAGEEVDHAVDHREQRHEREQRQVRERRGAQRDGLAAEAVRDEEHGAHEPAHSGKGKRVLAKSDEPP